MQIRVDHRTRTVHFGSDLSGAQSYNNMEGPHLQDMPSEQIRQQLMQMLEVLDKSLTTIHPDKIKIENNALRQKIVEAYHASKQRDHQRILRYVLVHTCPNLSKLVETCRNLSKIVENCQKMFKLV